LDTPIVLPINQADFTARPSTVQAISDVKQVARKPWIDYLRILAVSFVIVGHTVVDFFFMYGEIGQLEWWLANIVTGFCRYPVALFVMVSGAVLLGREYSLPEFYRRRAGRLIPPLVFWNLVYLLFYVCLGMDMRTVLWTLKAQMFADGYIAVHLWFLTMFVCLMLFVPFINKFINGQKPTGGELAWLLALASLYYVVNGVSSVGSALFGIAITWHRTFVWYIPYLIAGYYLSVYGDRIALRRRTIVALIVVLLAASAALNYLLATKTGVASDYAALGDAGPFGFLITSLIFLLAKKSPDILVEHPVVTQISAAAFGMYLIHEIFASLLVRSLPDFYSTPLIYVPIVIGLTAVLSLGAVLVMRKIPLLRAVC